MNLAQLKADLRARAEREPDEEEEEEQEIVHVIPRLLPWQRRLAQWVRPEGAMSTTVGALTVAHGVGKSFGAALRFATVVMSHPPWDGRGTQPLAIITAPTSNLLRSNSVPLFQSFIPPDLVDRVVNSPVWQCELVNGVKVEAWTADGEIDGVTAFAVWPDEVASYPFTNEVKWRKLRGRLRDPRVPREMVISGIAATGLTKDRFDHPDDPNTYIEFPGLKDSALDDAGRQDRLKDHPMEHREVVWNGGWLPMSVHAYQVEERLHRWDGRLDKTLPTFLTVDPGNKSCCLAWQMHGPLLVCVDEVHGYGDSEKLVEVMAERGWNVQEIRHDAQALEDTKTLIRRVVPGVAAYPFARKGSGEWSVDFGEQKVRRMLQSSTGETRLVFARHLWAEPAHPVRGVIPAMRTGLMDSRGRFKRDDVKDHAADNVRYAVVSWLEDPERAVQPDYSGASMEVW